MPVKSQNHPGTTYEEDHLYFAAWAWLGKYLLSVESSNQVRTAFRPQKRKFPVEVQGAKMTAVSFSPLKANRGVPG